MSLLWPGWFWLLLPVGAWLLYRRYSDGVLSLDGERIWLLVSLLCIVAALARPVIPKEPLEVEQRGSDIIVAVDLSASMQAADLAPTRLEAAKKLLGEMVRSDRKDRFGVIGFSTNAIVLSPLTTDAELLLHLFGGLDETLIMTKGTVIMPALKLARKMSRAKRPKLVVFSDGGDALDYAKEAAFAEESGIQVTVVMLATSYGSTLSKPGGGLLKDEKGDIVVTSRNDAVKLLADETGGAFIDGADLSALQGALRSQANEDFSTTGKMMEYRELFYYFVSAALAAFMLGITTLGRMLAGLIAPLLLLLGVSSQAGTLDFYHLHRADRAYAGGQFAEAAGAYAAVAKKSARYNAANSYYKAGEYEKALGLYKVLKSSDPRFKAALFFNIGNCYIRLQEFQKAREAFLKSLALQYDEAAVENLRFIAGAEEQDRMLTGRQKGMKRDIQSSSESSAAKKKQKEGGGSNMDVSAAASQGASEGGKKTRSDPRLGFSQGKAKLSSRQYELINQRSVNESKPW